LVLLKWALLGNVQLQQQVLPTTANTASPHHSHHRLDACSTVPNLKTGRYRGMALHRATNTEGTAVSKLIRPDFCSLPFLQLLHHEVSSANLRTKQL
ncbi:hypothetical protein BaRGS_00032496, partial [Batillaria attramentaria]